MRGTLRVSVVSCPMPHASCLIPISIPGKQSLERFLRLRHRRLLGFVGGDFLTEPLPTGYDALSFVRVLHDWPTPITRRLVEKAYHALPPHGLLLICEEFRTPERLALQFFWSYFLIGVDSCVSRLREIEFYTDLLQEVGQFAVELRHGFHEPRPTASGAQVVGVRFGLQRPGVPQLRPAGQGIVYVYRPEGKTIGRGETPYIEIAGKNMGMLKAGGVELRLVFHLFKQKDGGYAATMDSPDQGSNGIVLDEVSVTGDAVRLGLRLLRLSRHLAG